MSNILHFDYKEYLTFGSRLKAYRKSKNISVNEIVVKILEYQDNVIDDDLINNFRKTYYNWENDKTTPNIEVLDMMCNILDCDYDFLMGKIDVPKKKTYDIKKLTGLSENAIQTLLDLHNETIYNFKIHGGNYGLINVGSEFEIIKQATIDFLLSNREGKELLSHIADYLYSGYDNHQVTIKNEHLGYSVNYGAEFIKSAILVQVQEDLIKCRNNLNSV